MSAIDFRRLMRDERMRRSTLCRQGRQGEEGIDRRGDNHDGGGGGGGGNSNNNTQSSRPATTVNMTNGTGAGGRTSNSKNNPDDDDDVDDDHDRHGSLNRRSDPGTSKSALSSSRAAAVMTLPPPWTLSSDAHQTSCVSSLQELSIACGDPPLLRYQDRFLSPDYAAALAKWLDALPDARQYDPMQRQQVSNGVWTWLPHAQRKVAVFDWTATATTASSYDEKDDDDDNSTTAAHGAFRPVMEALRPLFPNNRPPNHLLINSYGPSHKGILPHTDGPAYYPLTCTISLGHVATFRLESPRNGDNDNEASSTGNTNLRLRLSGAGSLVVFSDDLYTKYLHSIDPHGGGSNDDDGDDDDDGLGVVSPGSMDLDEILSDCRTSQQQQQQQQQQQRHHRISITVRHKFPAA